MEIEFLPDWNAMNSWLDADKRVLHDTIVTINERLHDLVKRYGTTEEIRKLILINKSQVLLIERKIAGFMAIDLHK